MIPKILSNLSNIFLPVKNIFSMFCNCKAFCMTLYRQTSPEKFQIIYCQLHLRKIQNLPIFFNHSVPYIQESSWDIFCGLWLLDGYMNGEIYDNAVSPLKSVSTSPTTTILPWLGHTLLSFFYSFQIALLSKLFWLAFVFL